jgi:hypothetical protein
MDIVPTISRTHWQVVPEQEFKHRLGREALAATIVLIVSGLRISFTETWKGLELETN